MINQLNKLITFIGDKNLHALVNTIIVLLVGLLLNPIVGVIIAAIISIAKEIYDKKTTGFDYQDLIADSIGILLGLFILI